jgi:hypothetical protein
MNLLVALVIVLATAAVAAGLMVLVRHRAGAPVLNDPTRATTTLTMAGTAFAVLLAFITLAAFQTYNGAKDGADSEAAAVLTMFRTGALFPAQQRDELRGDLVCYGRAVVNQEWPAMGHSASAPVVDRWIAAYRGLFSGLQLHAAREQLALQELLTDARNRTDGRQERLSEATPSVPTPLWLVLVLGGVIAIVLQLAMADPRERLFVQASLVAGVAAIVAAGLLLVNFLDHPYTGHTGSIRPTQMERTLVMMRATEHGLRLPCGADGSPTT